MKKIKNSYIIIATIFLLLLISLITIPDNVLDATDVKDYSDTAKFFAGEYKAKQRASHTVLYGLLLSPYIKLTNSFFILKLTSVFWIILLILSLYYISNKDKKTLLLFVTTPLIWYMAPWISPLPLISLLFLWSYYFIKKFNSEEKIKFLIYSGLFMGLAAAFWNTALYFSFIFLLAFLYNKKFYNSWVFLISVFIGLLPQLIVDQFFFGFPFYSLLKHASAVIAFALYGGIYGQGYSIGLIHWIITLLFIPVYFYLFYKKKTFAKNKKTIIFLTLSILFILTNPQPRLLLVIAPIIILLLGKTLNAKQFKIQLIIFLILSLLVISPYLAQAYYETNGRYLTVALLNLPNLEFNFPPTAKLIKKDLNDITREYPNEIFVVGNNNDHYRELAHLYWGEGIQEFISIEDYVLWLNNETIIASKRISSNADPKFRREIWFEIGIGKNSNDRTDYDSIRYGISFGKNLDLDNFRLKREYRILNLFEKVK